VNALERQRAVVARAEARVAEARAGLQGEWAALRAGTVRSATPLRIVAAGAAAGFIVGRISPVSQLAGLLRAAGVAGMLGRQLRAFAGGWGPELQQQWQAWMRAAGAPGGQPEAGVAAGDAPGDAGAGHDAPRADQAPLAEAAPNSRPDASPPGSPPPAAPPR
jgi:hypothetical protein